MNLLGCLSLLCVLSSAVAKSRVKRLVGGKQYNDGDYSFHVSLWYMGDNPYTVQTPGMHHTCGGSLIEPQWVLTSAACFDSDVLTGLNDSSLWQVVLGMYSQRGAPDVATFMSIDEIFYCPDYNLFLRYGNIALLKLAEEAPLGGRIGLVDYNTDEDCPTAGQIAEVIGWGQIQTENFGLGSDYPYVGDANVTTMDYCHDVYAEPDMKEVMGGMVINDTYICAGFLEGRLGPCFGDAGSPLLYNCDGKNTVVGTVSYDDACGDPKHPAIYMRVSSFSDWIAETIQENS